MPIHDGMVWDQWRREMVRRGLASTTMAQRRSLLRRWERWCASRRVDWRQATVRDVEDWLDLRADLGARTRYNDLSSLAALYAWARRAGIADVDPTGDVLRPKLPQQLPRPCATDDLMTAIAAAGEPMRAMLVCMAWAGLRCCEVSSLDWSDVQLGDTPRMRVTGKGRRQRVIDLHPAVVGELRRLEVRRAGRVFRRPSGGAWTPGQVSREVSRHMAACGISASAHQLRHWFASTVYEASGDLRVVQELLGHASPATTSVYTALSSRRRQMAVSSLPGLRAAKAPRP